MAFPASPIDGQTYTDAKARVWVYTLSTDNWDLQSSPAFPQTSLDLKEDKANKDATGGYAGLTLFKINFKNAANTITSFFTNVNTVARTYTFQNRDGTIADDTDIAGREATIGTPGTDGMFLTRTIAGVWSWVVGAALGVAQAWAAGQYNVPTALTSSAGLIAWTAASSNNFSHTMTETTTLALPTDIASAIGQCGSIMITQDATTAFVLSLAAGWKATAAWAGITTTLSGQSRIDYRIVSATEIHYRLDAGPIV